MNKDRKFIIIFLLIWGLCFTVAGFLAGGKTLFYNKTLGNIESINENRTCYSYRINRERYDKCDSVYSSTYEVGKKVDVYYDKNDPIKSTLGVSKILFYIFSGLGVSAIITSIVLLVIPTKKKKLLETGIPINTTVISIEENNKIRFNGVHPTIIKTTGIYENEERIFKSDNLYNNIPLINEGNNITVYIDPKKPKRYYMDIK